MSLNKKGARAMDDKTQEIPVNDADDVDVAEEDFEDDTTTTQDQSAEVAVSGKGALAFPMHFDEIEPIELSPTALRAIEIELPGQERETYLLEAPKTRWMLWLPLNTSKTGSSNNLMIKQTLALVISLLVIISGVWFRLSLPPDSASIMMSAMKLLSYAIMIAGLIGGIAAGIWWHEGWQSWHCYRLCISTERLTLIDQPIDYPVGETPSIKLTDIKYVSLATSPDVHKHFLRSFLIGRLGLRYLVVDTIVSQDQRLHRIGPFRFAPYIRRVLMLAIERAKSVDKLDGEDVKNAHREWRKQNPYGDQQEFMRWYEENARQRAVKQPYYQSWRQTNPEGTVEQFEQWYAAQQTVS